MKSRALHLSLVLLTCTAMACGGSSFGIDGDAGITADQAATDVANAYCSRAQACAPAYVTVGFGDVATCSTRLMATLLPSFGAAGVTDDYGLAYAYATARFLRLADGPDEVHRNQIARLELKRYEGSESRTGGSASVLPADRSPEFRKRPVWIA